MRLKTCRDCGEAVELPLSNDDVDVEVTCPICGLYGPVEEWSQCEAEDHDTLLGRNLVDATIPASVPKRWALRFEQLVEIREVVVPLHQIRLLRQALDELNEGLPERIQRWFDLWHAEHLSKQELAEELRSAPAATAPCQPATQPAPGPPLPSPTKPRAKTAKRVVAQPWLPKPRPICGAEWTRYHRLGPMNSH